MNWDLELSSLYDEVLWLKSLLEELGFSLEDTTKLLCGNKSTISITNNLVQHIGVNKYIIKENSIKALICTPSVKTKNKLEDILTKVVVKETFNVVLQ